MMRVVFMTVSLDTQFNATSGVRLLPDFHCDSRSARLAYPAREILGENAVNTSRPCVVEALEERRLMAFSISFTNAGFGVLPGSDLSLPALADTNRGGSIALPPSNLKLFRQNSFDLRGLYQGNINIPLPIIGGNQPISINVTKQKNFRINAVVTVLGRSITLSNIPVNFATGRRVAFTAARSGASASIEARLNKDNTLTGRINASVGKERPACSEKTEECWSKNRRAHFVLKAQ
jgi:hypothetical protein